jgi:hypothetical protein
LDRAQILSAVYTKPKMITNYSNGSDLGLTVAPPSSETKTYLIEEPSPINWGRSCALASVNCLALAKDAMVDNVTTFEELDEDSIVLDAIGFFNAFDHFIKPVRTLKKAWWATGAGNNYPPGATTAHELTFELDQSIGADQA